MGSTNKLLKLSDGQITVLILLRIAIGWHFLYEGLVKLLNPNWTSAGYLMDSQGFMKGFFHYLATNSTILEIVDILNIVGLIAIGLGLILGFLASKVAIAGIVLLGLYYLSHPPFIGLQYAMPSEGSYLFINKIFLEIIALAVISAFPTSKVIGIDRLLLFVGRKRRLHA